MSNENCVSIRRKTDKSTKDSGKTKKTEKLSDQMQQDIIGGGNKEY